jgi:hypothetical protein
MTLALFLKYWREILLGLLLLAIAAAALYVGSVFAERDRLLTEKAVLETRLGAAERMLEQNNRITEAIGRIRLRSSVNVQRIESEPKPVFVDSGPIAFIPGGLPYAAYSSSAAGGALPRAAPGGSLPAAKSPGGILPD